ncbi:hypothetical protein [Sphingobacterium sp. UBA6645]|uniref:hypothetical protein n=1 Tax=Sphingobacterium sp. UBA6645 TaxID=1947511 RepID=UPI0025FD5945|nr:hypothetical protein [Sphingobacterium sp. UBA6645]
MNYQGTNGKWKAVQREKTYYAPKTNEIQFGEDGECVAEFVGNDYDAQLIAHAPEMMEMLSKVLEVNKRHGFNGHLINEQIKELLTRATTIK